MSPIVQVLGVAYATGVVSIVIVLVSFAVFSVATRTPFTYWIVEEGRPKRKANPEEVALIALQVVLFWPFALRDIVAAVKTFRWTRK